MAITMFLKTVTISHLVIGTVSQNSTADYSTGSNAFIVWLNDGEDVRLRNSWHGMVLGNMGLPSTFSGFLLK